MDTKSTNNSNAENSNASLSFIDIEHKIEHKTKAVKHKKGSIKIFILTLIMFSFFLSIFLAEKSVSPYFSYIIPRDLIYNDAEINYQIVRYAKNLQRFFIYFKDFTPSDTYAPSEEISIDTLKKEIEMLEVERDQKIREVENIYFNILNRTTYGNDIITEDDSPELIENKDLYSDNTENDISNDISNNISNDISNDISLEEANIFGQEFAKKIEVTPDNIDNINSFLERQRENQRQSIIEEYQLIIDDKNRLLSDYTENEGTTNYFDVKRYLMTTDEFKYYIENNLTGEVMTNIESSDAKTEAEFSIVCVSLYDDIFNTMFNGETLIKSFMKNNLSGYIIIPDSYITKSESYINLMSKYNILKSCKSITVPLFVLSIIGIILSFLFERKNIYRLYSERLCPLLAKIPILVKIPLFFILILIAASYPLDEFRYSFTSGPTLYIWNLTIILFFLAAFIFAVLFYSLLSLFYLIYIIKNLSLIKKEPEFRFICNFFSDLFMVFAQKNTSLVLSMVFLIILGILSQFILFIIAIESYSEFATFILCELIFLIFYLFIFYLIVALARVNSNIDEVINGKLDEIEMERGFFKSIILKLNLLRGGVRRVIVERNKSDRLKTELITNVSHDLKTPLTSIINYIELLKGPNLTELQKDEYLQVIDLKSQRLKILIEDLFEATKLSSGQIKLEIEKADIVELLKQTLGELNEKIVDSDIAFKFSASNNHIYMFIDGKKMWRVFENLIINIVNYSQAGTRAYIDITEFSKYVEITFKSTSSYEMNFDSSELFERFKRGDESRTTEGSGLGLSIAKDIVELHNGELNIIIDGDLFKVIIKLFYEGE